MNCPVCKKGTIALCQDAIIPHSIVYDKVGKLKVGNVKRNAIDYLENTWVECNKCKATSDSDDQQSFRPALEKIWEQL